ncbi:MAG: 2-hydroxyacid dehydrogenase [Rubrivivax sp.]
MVDITQDLLQIGYFPAPMQALIDREFRCHDLATLERDDALRQRVRGIVTRSNFEVSAAAMERLPQLGIVAVCGVGYDKVALDFAAARGVVITHTPAVLDAAVAELGVGLLLSLLRRLPQADRHVRDGRWAQTAFPLATDLAGKRVGIVGLGRIGHEIARRLEPFGVTLAYHGRTDQQIAWRFHAELLSLARDSDVLILTAPGGPATARAVNAAVLDALGADGFLVNIARGSLVDQTALIDALSRRSVAGAALDVFDDEPTIDPRLFTLDNVVLAPHIGSATVETRLAMTRLTLDNLHRFFAQEPVLTPVMTLVPAP